MPSVRWPRTAVLIAVPLVMVLTAGAAPSSAMPRAMPQKGALMRRPTPSAPILYVSDANGPVYAFDSADHTMLAVITDGSQPEGLDVDASGTLYVAEAATASVNVYAAGATTATSILSDPIGHPIGVAHCPDGTTYVANQYGTDFGPGGIVYYAGNATAPSGTIVDPSIGEAYSVACDSASNVYADFSDINGATQIVRYGPEGQSSSNTGFGAFVDDTGALRVTSGAALAVSSSGYGSISFFNLNGPPAVAPQRTSSWPANFFGFSLGINGNDAYVAVANEGTLKTAGGQRRRRSESLSPQSGTVFRANDRNLRLIRTYGADLLINPYDAYVFPGANT